MRDLLIILIIILSVSSLAINVSATPATVYVGPTPYQLTDSYCDIFLEKFFENNMTIEEINVISSEIRTEMDNGNTTYCCRYAQGGPFYAMNVQNCKESVIRQETFREQEPYKQAFGYGIYYIDMILTFIITFLTIPLIRRYSKREGNITKILNILFASLGFLILFYWFAYIVGDMIFL
jgi:hypothetical protein